MAKPLLIEVKGVQFRNKGAYLMLIATKRGLEKLGLNYQLVLSPGPNLPYLERAKSGAWQKLAFRRFGFDFAPVFNRFPKALVNVLRRYGIVTEQQVDIVIEASGFAYGDQWPLQFLQNTAKEVRRCHLANKPFIFMPQAFGPFTSAASKAAMATIIEYASLIFVRDVESMAHLQSCVAQLPSHVHLSCDFTIGLKPSPPITTPALAAGEMNSRYAVLIPNHKIVSKYHHQTAEADHQNYVESFAAAADFLLLQGIEVYLLNHEGVQDQQICQEIAQLSKAKLLAIADPLDLKRFIGQAELVVSSRFHGAINALSQGVPCIATSWSHKYQQMMADFAVADYCLETVTPQIICQKLTQLLQQHTELKTVINHSTSALLEQNNHMWQLIAEELAVHPSR